MGIMLADDKNYLADVVRVLRTQWPQNRTVNIVCHGHSVPAGFFETPLVNTFDAYPHLLHQRLKHRFPWAVVNVIVTAKGGEESDRGAARFADEVLCHRPDVLTIDYGLNDRRIGLENARRSWETMIAAALERKTKVLLLTPTADFRDYHPDPAQCGESWRDLVAQAAQIRRLADQFGVGLVDSFAAFDRHVNSGGQLMDLMSHVNHPNRRGHELVADELLKWFPLGE